MILEASASSCNNLSVRKRFLRWWESSVSWFDRPPVWRVALLSWFSITVRHPGWSWSPALHLKHADKTKQLLSVLPLRRFSLARRHLFPGYYREEQFGWGGPVGSFKDMNLQYSQTIEIAPTVPCSTRFPAGTTMALFKCHPIEPPECQIRTGCLVFQAQKEVIKQSLGQWIPSNWEAHTWQRGSSFSRQRWCCLPEWKSSGAPVRLKQPSSTFTVRSGSLDCRSGVTVGGGASLMRKKLRFKTNKMVK